MFFNLKVVGHMEVPMVAMAIEILMHPPIAHLKIVRLEDGPTRIFAKYLGVRASILDPPVVSSVPTPADG